MNFKKIERKFLKEGVRFYGFSDNRIIVRTNKRDRKLDMSESCVLLTEMGIVVCNILEELNPNYILLHFYIKDLEDFNQTVTRYKIVKPSLFNGTTKEEE